MQVFMKRQTQVKSRDIDFPIVSSLVGVFRFSYYKVMIKMKILLNNLYA